MTPLEVPEREVEHGFDDDEWADVSGTGTATLDMSNQAKAAARRKERERAEKLGGFGFRGRT